MKAQENQSKENESKEEVPDASICGTMKISEIMAKCCEHLSKDEIQGMSEMMAKCRQAMSKAADGYPLIKQQTQTRRTGK